jgi:hypothetical protein
MYKQFLAQVAGCIFAVLLCVCAANMQDTYTYEGGVQNDAYLNNYVGSVCAGVPHVYEDGSCG